MSGSTISYAETRLPLRWSHRLHDRRRPLEAAALALVIAAAALVALQARHPRETTVITPPEGRSASPPPARAQADTATLISFDGGTPTAFPDSRLGLASASLDGQVDRVVALLGDPASRRPDIVGTVASWTLPAGAWFTASTWQGTGRIAALQASVPPGSPVAVAAYGGVVIGRSSLRDVVSAWGDGFATAADPFDDYAVRYVECVGSLPVVVKFDQAARDHLGVPGAVLWDEPVTRVLIAYADEPAGSEGCR